jgi:hypothetical protein
MATGGPRRLPLQPAFPLSSPSRRISLSGPTAVAGGRRGGGAQPEPGVELLLRCQTAKQGRDWDARGTTWVQRTLGSGDGFRGWW